MTERPLSIPTPHGPVPAILLAPSGAAWLYVFAHGAGAGMRHAFMQAMAARLADRDVASLRYEYPYVSAGSRRPDPAPTLEGVTRAVCDWVAHEQGILRLAAGGKSMGGRMTSRAQAEKPLARVERLIFLGFPLHPAGQPGTSRAEHLDRVLIPMLFLQGTRDTLADLALVRSVCERLGERATLHVLDGADHSFAVLKRSGRTNEQVLDELADTMAGWLG